MEQREQNGNQHREHEAQLDVIVDQFSDQQSAEQGAKQTEAHGDGQGELLQGTANTLESVSGNSTGEDNQVRKAAQSDGTIDIGQGSRQGNGCTAD